MNFDELVTGCVVNFRYASENKRNPSYPLRCTIHPPSVANPTDPATLRRGIYIKTTTRGSHNYLLIDELDPRLRPYPIIPNDRLSRLAQGRKIFRRDRFLELGLCNLRGETIQTPGDEPNTLFARRLDGNAEEIRNERDDSDANDGDDNDGDDNDNDDNDNDDNDNDNHWSDDGDVSEYVPPVRRRPQIEPRMYPPVRRRPQIEPRMYNLRPGTRYPLRNRRAEASRNAVQMLPPSYSTRTRQGTRSRYY